MKLEPRGHVVKKMKNNVSGILEDCMCVHPLRCNGNTLQSSSLQNSRQNLIMRSAIQRGNMQALKTNKHLPELICLQKHQSGGIQTLFHKCAGTCKVKSLQSGQCTMNIKSDRVIFGNHQSSPIFVKMPPC